MQGGGAIVVQKDGYLDINYILHLQQEEIIVPLTADVTTTANVPDNKMYIPLTSSSSSSVFSLPSLRYMAADPGI